ncbi:hypothetical protein BCR33DRAFT_532337 [Rhizoclosmatium globosum]|uniref:Uncharacterized protein n=1 Tax=Rhizoclosmatium globosum TaxID=329046 RepID=A0A1Y2CUL0_9FUNG|nr:hypothetical protein BCR33DRAFT_532337 [Rhizoclosmatium globosum]|eukprot:ORY50576.1 hypothetical protein BCR33DRAFT_532337 [Rhizoclosmatium globosum]
MNLIIPLILASLASADTSIDAQKAAALLNYTLPQCAKACVNEDTLGGYNEFLNATFWMSQSPYVNWTRGMVEGEGRAFGKVCEGVLGRGSGIEVCVEGKGCADAVVDVVKGYVSVFLL